MTVESAHWICVRAMSVSAMLFNDLFTEASFVASIEDAIGKKIDSGLVVIDVEPFLREWEPTFPGTRLLRAFHFSYTK